MVRKRYIRAASSLAALWHTCHHAFMLSPLEAREKALSIAATNYPLIPTPFISYKINQFFSLLEPHNMIEHKVLCEIVESIATRYVINMTNKSSTEYGNCFEVPKSLRKYRIYHLESLNQSDGFSCGSRAALNIKAVQELMRQNVAITSQEIASFVEDNQHRIKQFRHTDTTLEEFIAELGLSNTFIYGETTIKEVLDQKKKIFKVPKNSDTFSSFHLIDIGGHWVAIALLKEKGQKPVFLYLDSCNAPLREKSLIAKLFS